MVGVCYKVRSGVGKSHELRVCRVCSCETKCITSPLLGNVIRFGDMQSLVVCLRLYQSHLVKTRVGISELKKFSPFSLGKSVNHEM